MVHACVKCNIMTSRVFVHNIARAVRRHGVDAAIRTAGPTVGTIGVSGDGGGDKPLECFFLYHRRAAVFFATRDVFIHHLLR